MLTDTKEDEAPGETLYSKEHQAVNQIEGIEEQENGKFEACCVKGNNEKLESCSKTQMKKRSRKEAKLRLREERKVLKKQKKASMQKSLRRKAEIKGEGSECLHLERKVKKTESDDEKGCDIVRAAAASDCNSLTNEQQQRLPRSQRRKQEFLDKCRNNATIVIDCQFEGLQTEREISSLTQQLMYTYGANRRSDHPFRVIICGIYGGLQNCLDKLSGYENWNCQKTSESCDALFGWTKSVDKRDGCTISTLESSPTTKEGEETEVGDKLRTRLSTATDQKNRHSSNNVSQVNTNHSSLLSTPSPLSLSSTQLSNSSAVFMNGSDNSARSDMGDSLETHATPTAAYSQPTNHHRFVYLTADSDQVLESVDASSVYILGGLVDRNRYSGITAQRAKAWNIRTARLPIQDHVKLDGSKILTVNQVFDILSQFVRLKNWKDAICAAIPSRKLKKEQTSLDDKQDPDKKQDLDKKQDPDKNQDLDRKQDLNKKQYREKRRTADDEYLKADSTDSPFYN